METIFGKQDRYTLTDDHCNSEPVFLGTSGKKDKLEKKKDLKKKIKVSKFFMQIFIDYIDLIYMYLCNEFRKSIDFSFGLKIGSF